MGYRGARISREEELPLDKGVTWCVRQGNTVKMHCGFFRSYLRLEIKGLADPCGHFSHKHRDTTHRHMCVQTHTHTHTRNTESQETRIPMPAPSFSHHIILNCIDIFVLICLILKTGTVELDIFQESLKFSKPLEMASLKLIVFIPKIDS